MSLSSRMPGSISISSHTLTKSSDCQSLSNELSFRNINELFLFPFYDELLRIIKLNSFFSIFLIIVIIVQVSKSFPHFLDNLFFNFFSDFNFSSAYAAFTFPVFYLFFNIFFFVYLFLNYRTKRIFSYWQLFVASLILNFFNPMFFVPACGVCGYSSIQLEKVMLSHYTDIYDPTTQNGNGAINFTKNINVYDNKHLYFSNLGNSFMRSNYQNDQTIKKHKDIKGNSNIKFDNYNQSHENNNINDNNFRYESQKQNYHRTFTYKKLKKKSVFDDYSDKNLPPPTYRENEKDMQTNLFLDSNFSKYVFSLIISFILAVLIFSEVLINYNFVSHSPYLNRTCFSMWDPKVFTSSLLVLGLTQFSYIFLSILPSWCTICFQVVMLIFIAYIIYFTFFQPFICIAMNSFMQSLLVSSFFGTFFVIVYTLKPSHIILFIINGTFVLFFIFFIFFYFINKKIISNINRKLSPPNTFANMAGYFDDDRTLKKNSANNQVIELNDLEKREIFDSYVFQSIEHALLYLRVGISCASPYFVDFSFIKYMKDCYGQNPIQFFILQLTALFPSQHQFMSYCMTNMSKKEDFFNIFEMFLMYQLRRINIIRQSNVSKVIQNDLAFLEKNSDECISTIRGFWAELLQAKTNFCASSLGYIRRMTLNTRSCYIDAIDKYPNSQQILNSYARFLCESCGDYMSCTQIGQKMRKIEKGKNVHTDFCFLSFVNVFPQYLHKRILDIKGCFIDNKTTFIQSQSSSSFSDDDDKLFVSFDLSRDIYLNGESNNVGSPTKKRNKEEFEKLIDKEHFDTLIDSLFDQGKLRLSIQQIVNKSYSRDLTVTRIISIIQILVSILITCFSFIYLPNFNSPIQIIKSSARVSNIISSIQYCSLIAGVRYLSEEYHVNISSSIIKHLNIRDENLPKFSCTFINSMLALDQKKHEISNLIDSEMQFLLNNPDNHQNEIKIYTGLNIDLQENQTYDDSEDENDSLYEKGVFLYKFVKDDPNFYKVSLRSGIEYFQTCAERLAHEHILYVLENPDEKNFSHFYNTYFELLINGLTLSEPFYHLFQVISDNGTVASNSIRKSLYIIALVTFFVCFLFFFIARIYNFIQIKKSLKLAALVLQKVKNEDIVESFKPIYLKSNKPIKIHSTSKHSIYENSPSLILHQIVSISSLICFFAFFIGFIFQFIKTFTFVNKTFQWANNGASRFLSLTMMMNLLIARKVTNVDISVSNEMNQKIMNLLESSHKLDLSIIGKGKELDQFYFMINDVDALIEENVVENKTENSTKSITKHPFHLNSKKIKNSKAKNKNLLSPLSDLSINLLNQETQNQLNYTLAKCAEYNNANASTQMNLATYLDCISIENKINFGIHFYLMLENSQNKPANLIESPEFISSLFIIDKYLYSDLPKFQDQISFIACSEIERQMEKVQLIGFVGIGIAVFLFLIENLLIHFIYLSYDAFRQLILILPPKAFMNNLCLLNFFISAISNVKVNINSLKNPFANPFSKKIRLYEKALSSEDIMINSMDHPVISTCKDLIIQYVNPAVQTMTGFPSDQLLGQGLSYLIPLESGEEKSNAAFDKVPFYQRLEEIKSNIGERVAEVNAKCLNDKGEELNVQATIIGIFDKKTSPKTKEVVDDELEEIINNNDNDENDEEFVGTTIILKDISYEIKQKKIIKETKKKTEALLNLLLPQPILEEIRTSNKPIFKQVETATLVKMELIGLDEYVSSMMPRHVMTFLQNLYKEIRQITRKEEQILFTKPDSERRNNHPRILPKMSSLDFNFEFTAVTEMDDDFMFRRQPFTDDLLDKFTKPEEEIDDDNNNNNEYEDDIDDCEDENCDFKCIYNIRNDNDSFISIAGLFDTQNELRKQAESCVRYALKIKQIINKIQLEDQLSLFIHTRIAVCMGGPVEGFVLSPENPNVEIFSDLLKEADIVKDNGDVDFVYINENVYNYLNKDDYVFEEKILKFRKPIAYTNAAAAESEVYSNDNSSDVEINIYNENDYDTENVSNNEYDYSNGSINIEDDIIVGSNSSSLIEDIYDFQKVYVVKKCLRKKKKMNENDNSKKSVLIIPTDSTE